MEDKSFWEIPFKEGVKAENSAHFCNSEIDKPD